MVFSRNPAVEQREADYEAALIGCILRKPAGIADAKSEPFHFRHYRKFWAAIRKNDNERKPIDVVALNEIVDDPNKLIELSEGMPASGNVRFYDKKVRDAYRARSVYDVCARGLELASAPDGDGQIGSIVEDMFRAAAQEANEKTS